MGYYTTFTLDIDHSYGKEAIEATLAAEKQEVSASNLPLWTKEKIHTLLEEKYKHEYIGIGEVLQELDYDPFEQSTKWYDHEKDMLRVSEKYPSVLFILSGQGEESDDMWRKYFYNGKVQSVDAVVTYPPFDESKLGEGDG